MGASIREESTVKISALYLNQKVILHAWKNNYQPFAHLECVYFEITSAHSRCPVRVLIVQKGCLLTGTLIWICAILGFFGFLAKILRFSTIFWSKIGHFWPILIVFEVTQHSATEIRLRIVRKIHRNGQIHHQSVYRSCTSSLVTKYHVKQWVFAPEYSKRTYFTLLPPSGSLCGGL